MFTLREPSAAAGTGTSQVDRPLDAVSVVADQSLVWDRANNLMEVFDGRPGEEWPDGFRPQSYRVDHDSLYRVADIELDYTQDGGKRTPVDSFVDWRDEQAEVEAVDPMQQKPAPMLPARPEGRVASLTYEYDWLANMVEWNDDAYQFYERSLGAITNGEAEGGGRPSALRLASDLERTAPSSGWVPEGGRGGYLATEYGEGGNLVSMTVHAQCGDAAGAGSCYDPMLGTEARVAYLGANCSCASEQHYQYRWDELNRLVEARRYDRSGGAGGWDLAARQRYRYDAANQRSVKQTINVATGGGEDPERIALYALPGDLERRGLVRDPLLGDGYVAGATGRVEDQYLVGGARLVWTDPRNPGATLDADARVTVAIGDLIGTTSAVLDLVSGALVETSTYYPNGARESYRAPDGGEVGPEPAGFTGKEGDEEVGLTYFGERYLVSRIGRWASPDPLWVHADGGGEALNAFHYVSGNLLQARDPIGLDWVKDLYLSDGRFRRHSPGQLQVAREGNRPTPYVPGPPGHPHPNSGLTVGPGYDAATRTEDRIRQDMRAVGASQRLTNVMADAAGLRGADAEEHETDITSSPQGMPQMPGEVRDRLLPRMLQEYQGMAMRRSTANATVLEEHRAARPLTTDEWGGLHEYVVELLGDIAVNSAFYANDRVTEITDLVRGALGDPIAQLTALDGYGQTIGGPGGRATRSEWIRERISDLEAEAGLDKFINSLAAEGESDILNSDSGESDSTPDSD